MPLSGKDLEKLQNAMLQAYPNKSDLEQLVRFKLNKNLDAIAWGEKTQDIIFNLIKWAESTGNWENLLNAVSQDEERDNNSDLRQCVTDILTKIQTLESDILTKTERRTELDTTQSFPSPPESKAPFKDNLPKQKTFIGRKKELESLLGKINKETPDTDTKNPLIVISGQGGIGKSALIIKAGHQIKENHDKKPSPSDFAAIILISLKQPIVNLVIDTSCNSIIDTSYDSINDALSYIFRTIANTLDQPSINRVTSDKQCNEVYKCLEEQNLY